MSRNSYRWDTSAFWPQFLTSVSDHQKDIKPDNILIFWDNIDTNKFIDCPRGHQESQRLMMILDPSYRHFDPYCQACCRSCSRTSTDLQGPEATSTAALWSMRWNDRMSQMFAEIYWECLECLPVAFAQIYSRWSRAEHITRLGIDWILLCETSKPCWSWKLSASCDMFSSLRHIQDKLIWVAVTTKRLVPPIEWSYWLPRYLCAMMHSLAGLSIPGEIKRHKETPFSPYTSAASSQITCMPFRNDFLRE